MPAPRTHLLKDLLSLLTPHHPNLGGFPGDKASKRQAAAAMRWAGKVRVACRQLLGLRSR